MWEINCSSDPMALKFSWHSWPEPRGSQKTDGRPHREAIFPSCFKVGEKMKTQPGSNATEEAPEEQKRGAVGWGPEQEVQQPRGSSPHPR